MRFVTIVLFELWEVVLGVVVGALVEAVDFVAVDVFGLVRFQYVAAPFHSHIVEWCGDLRRWGAKRGVRDVGGM